MIREECWKDIRSLDAENINAIQQQDWQPVFFRNLCALDTAKRSMVSVLWATLILPTSEGGVPRGPNHLREKDQELQDLKALDYKVRAPGAVSNRPLIPRGSQSVC